MKQDQILSDLEISEFTAQFGENMAHQVIKSPDEQGSYSLLAQRSPQCTNTLRKTNPWNTKHRALRSKLAC